jgi:hypothetical protein
MASTLIVANVARPRALQPVANGRFVVELAVSAAPFDPHSVPHLDLFGIYHLYHQIHANHGQVRNSLRLGFFNDAGAANAVAHYATAYFDSPRAVQISTMEEVESARHVFRAMKDVGANGQSVAIELRAPPPLRREVVSTPARPAKVAQHPPSLWSRLFSPRAC